MELLKSLSLIQPGLQYTLGWNWWSHWVWYNQDYNVRLDGTDEVTEFDTIRTTTYAWMELMKSLSLTHNEDYNVRSDAIVSLPSGSKQHWHSFKFSHSMLSFNLLTYSFGISRWWSVTEVRKDAQNKPFIEIEDIVNWMHQSTIRLVNVKMPVVTALEHPRKAISNTLKNQASRLKITTYWWTIVS